MQHVDEGHLHALLDEALEPAEATALHEHIAACPECAARLEEERAVRQRAIAILDAARPFAGNVPPFEAVLRRAETPSKRAGLPGPQQLAWAASIILALGVGWFGRSIAPEASDSAAFNKTVPSVRELSAPATPPPGAPAPLGELSATPRGAAMSQPAAAPPEKAEEALRADRVSAMKERVAGAGGVTASLEKTVTAATATANSVAVALPTVAAVTPTQAPLQQQQQAAGQIQVQSLRDSAGLMRMAGAGRGGGGGGGRGGRSGVGFADTASRQRAETRQAEANRAVSLDQLVVTGAAAAAAPAMRWEYLDLQRAEARAGRKILVVPGLDLLTIGVAETPSGFLVRTTQRLPRDGMLEVQQNPIAVANAAGLLQTAATDVKSDEAGGWIVTLRRPDIVLLGRSTLPPDSIRALLLRAR